MLLTRFLRRSQVTSSCRRLFKVAPEAAGSSTGLFGNDVLRDPSGFAKLNKEVEERASELVKRIEEGDSSRTTVELVDDLSNEICVAADLTECVRQLHVDSHYSSAAEESSRKFCHLIEGLNTYTPLYRKLKNSRSLEADRLNETDVRTLDLLVDDFEQSGVHLAEQQRNEFVRLSGEIFDAGARFQWGCDRSVEVGRADKKRFMLESTVLHTPITHSSARDKRKFVYNSFMRHNDEQEKSLRALISARHELSRLTGFESYAHRAQKNTLLGSYENAHQFLCGLIQACRPHAEKELAVLVDVLRQCDTTTREVGEWDIAYLSHLYKERAYGVLPQTVLGKFVTLGNVLRGFTELAEQLYDVRFEFRIPAHGEVWLPTVIKMVVLDSCNNELGTVYLDVERRPTKAVGDCHYTVRCSKQLENGSWQSPIAVLSLSLADYPMKDFERLPIALHAAENVFHELGHAMHSMLGRTKYQHIAGTRCPTDFAEVPSILMEYFFNDLSVMQRTLRTPEGESIDVRDAAVLISSKYAFNALETVQQASYALFDLELHNPEISDAVARGKLSTSELFSRIATQALPHVERDPHTAYQHRFHHLVSYGAKYYSYLVARASASLVWHTHFEENPFDRQRGRKWAEAQSHGGGVASADLLASMLGSPPSASRLIQSIVKETENASNLSAVNI